MPKVYAEVYGCAANKSDHEIMLAQLRKSGFKIAKRIEDADLVLLTTCVVKTPTANRMIEKIKQLTKTKLPLVIAGCMPKAERKLVERLNPKASLLGPGDVEKAGKVASLTIGGKRIVALEGKTEKSNLPHLRLNPVVEIAQIANGCLSACSFCETKLARGRLRSFRIEDITNQVCSALMEGCKEIWLTAQDTSCYGFDLGLSLVDLLESVTSIEGRFLVRVGMMNPTHLKRIDLSKLVKLFKNEKIFKFLHLPVQSGSNQVLEDMRREYRVEDFLKIVEKFRNGLPDLTLSTDLIVGFPTESEADFKDSVKLVEYIKPDLVNVSRFFPRPKTHASKLKQLPSSVIKQRSIKMHKLVKKISLERNQRWIGWEGSILVDEIGKGNVWRGRNLAYKSVVIRGKYSLGEFVEVKVKKARSSCLIAS